MLDQVCDDKIAAVFLLWNLHEFALRGRCAGAALKMATRPKLPASRGGWEKGNSSGWSPWSGLFSRPISDLTGIMLPPLPSFRSILAFGEHRNYLEIGCGLGRGLLEVQSMMANSTTSTTSGQPFCATGLSFLNYTHFVYDATWTEEPTQRTARRMGLAALFEEGPLPPETIRVLRSRFHLGSQPESAPAPVIIDADYNHGLPFLADTFDLILEQGSLKWEEPRMLPDPERRLEDYGRFFFDELLRYHSRAAFPAHILGCLPSPMRCCADTLHCVGPHLPCLSLSRVLRIGGSALIDLGLLRQKYGTASPHPSRTQAATLSHPRRVCVIPVPRPRCRKPLAL